MTKKLSEQTIYSYAESMVDYFYGESGGMILSVEHDEFSDNDENDEAKEYLQLKIKFYEHDNFTKFTFSNDEYVFEKEQVSSAEFPFTPDSFMEDPTPYRIIDIRKRLSPEDLDLVASLFEMRQDSFREFIAELDEQAQDEYFSGIRSVKLKEKLLSLAA